MNKSEKKTIIVHEKGKQVRERVIIHKKVALVIYESKDYPHSKWERYGNEIIDIKLIKAIAKAL